MLGEGFFKLVITLTEKGIYKAGPEVLLNFAFGGLAVFLLAWIYFDFVGNGRIRDSEPATVIVNWFGHFGLMLSGVVVGATLRSIASGTRGAIPVPCENRNRRSLDSKAELSTRPLGGAYRSATRVGYREYREGKKSSDRGSVDFPDPTTHAPAYRRLE